MIFNSLQMPYEIHDLVLCEPRLFKGSEIVRESVFLWKQTARSLQEISRKGSCVLLSDGSESPFCGEDGFPVRSELIDDVRSEPNGWVEEEVRSQREGESEEGGIQQLVFSKGNWISRDYKKQAVVGR